MGVLGGEIGMFSNVKTHTYTAVQVKAEQCLVTILQRHSCFTGGRIDIDVADRLVNGLKGLPSQGFGNRQFWKEKLDKSWKSVNSVRWRAGHDVNQDVLENFVEMRQFLAEVVTTDGKDNKSARQLLVSNRRQRLKAFESFEDPWHHSEKSESQQNGLTSVHVFYFYFRKCVPSSNDSRKSLA